MARQLKGLLYLCLLIVVPTAVFILDLRYARSLGSGVSATADPYDEPNVVRAGINYRLDGFFRNGGLPNLGGGYLVGQGTCPVASLDEAREQLIRAGGSEWSGRSDAEVIEEYQKLTKRVVVIQALESAECPVEVYTHYPPGTHIIAGVFFHFLGVDQLWRLRVLPLSLTFASLIWLVWEFRLRFGGPLAAIAGAAIAMSGALRLFSHSLYYHGYASALLLMQIAAVLMALRRWESAATRRLAVVVVGVFAFVQGWLSFDFMFLVTLAALPLLWSERKLSRGSATAFMLVPLLAWGLADFLHFLQVAVYYGSLLDAVKDFTGAALGRSVGPYVDYVGPLPSRAALLLDYIRTFVFLPNKFFGWSLPVAAVGLMLLLLWSDVGNIAQKEALRALTTLILSMFVSSVWVFVMQQHAVVHTHLLPRHFLLLFVVALYSIGDLLRLLLPMPWSALANWRLVQPSRSSSTS